MAEYRLEELSQSDWENIQEGDILLFGKYPKEEKGELLPIEWEVLRIEDGKFFLLSVYGLDVRQFDSHWPMPFTDERITWLDSDLRAWLNGEFWNTAFQKEERRLIFPKRITDDGKTDKVRLLYWNEAEKYIKPGRKDANLTPLANAKIRKEHADSIRYCWRWDRGWWLASISGKDKARCVVYSWQLESISENICTDHQAVRPALWLDPNGDYPTEE